MGQAHDQATRRLHRVAAREAEVGRARAARRVHFEAPQARAHFAAAAVALVLVRRDPFRRFGGRELTSGPTGEKTTRRFEDDGAASAGERSWTSFGGEKSFFFGGRRAVRGASAFLASASAKSFTN